MSDDKPFVSADDDRSTVSVSFTASSQTLRDLMEMFPDATSPSDALRQAILEVRLHRLELGQEDAFERVDIDIDGDDKNE